MGNTPNIRFKGFTDDWEQRKLGEVCEIKDSARIPNSEWSESGVPYIRASDVTNENTDGVLFISQERYEFYKNRTGAPTKNDVLFNGGGEIGKSLLITDKKPIYVQGGAVLYARTSKSRELVGQYLKTYFETTNAKSYVDTASAGGTMRHFTLKPSQMMRILMPSVEEQEKIGEYFANLDHLITFHQCKCEETKKLKRYMLQKMFPKKGETKPEIRFEGFTDDWEQRKFGDVVEIGSGMDYKHLGEGDIPVYGTGGYMLSVDSALSEEKDAIGIGRKGTIDKPYILRAPFWTVDTLFYCIPKENHDLVFTNCLFQTVDWKKKDESTGVPSLSKVIISNVEAMVPSFHEQKKIGEYFNNLDHLITLHQCKCDKLKELKKYMLQNMFV